MEFASQEAQALADELNVNVQLIEGTGKLDRITVADVRRGAEEQAVTSPVGPPAEELPDAEGPPEVEEAEETIPGSPIPPEGIDLPLAPTDPTVHEPPPHVPGPPIAPKRYACVRAEVNRESGKATLKTRFRGKPFAELTARAKLDRALRHFKIKRSDVISHRVYPHKVAIVYRPEGKKATYWVDEVEG